MLNYTYARFAGDVHMNRSSAVIKGLSDESTRAVILTPNDTLSYWNGSHLTRGPLFIQASGMLIA